MEFSKNYLFKYGWKEGEGLGKTNDGMKDAIKPKLKFDKAGIGFDPSLEFTDHWWEQVYNNAAKKHKKEVKENKALEFRDKKEDLKGLSADEHLFKVCGGRTAHKGARHGLKLNGKLKRLEEQEKEIVNGCSAKRHMETREELPNKRVKSKRKSKNSEEEKQLEPNI